MSFMSSLNTAGSRSQHRSPRESWGGKEEPWLYQVLANAHFCMRCGWVYTCVLLWLTCPSGIITNIFVGMLVAFIRSVIVLHQLRICNFTFERRDREEIHLFWWWRMMAFRSALCSQCSSFHFLKFYSQNRLVQDILVHHSALAVYTKQRWRR